MTYIRDIWGSVHNH